MAGMRRPVAVIIGMMGAGKTRVGKEAAQMMQLPFADADNEIEHDAGMKIPEYFERYGEPEFRKLESDVVLDMLEDFDGIFSLGGGAPMTPVHPAGARRIHRRRRQGRVSDGRSEGSHGTRQPRRRPSDAQRRRQRALEEVVQGTRPGVQTRGQCAGAHPRTNPASGREKADGNDRSNVSSTSPDPPSNHTMCA